MLAPIVIIGIIILLVVGFAIIGSKPRDKKSKKGGFRNARH
jgi:hypothetical protein